MRRRVYLYVTGLSFIAISACGGLSRQPDASGEPPPASLDSGDSSSGNGRGGAGSGTAMGSPAAGGAGASTSASPPRDLGRRIPGVHRVSGTTCDRERPPGNARPYNDVIPCPEDGGSCAPSFDCADCRVACVDYGDGLGSRCVTSSGECLSDADCTEHDNGRCWDNRGRWYCTYDTCYSDATCTTGGPCACEGESGSAGNTCLPGNCQTDADCGANGYCSPTLGGCGNYSGVIAYYCHTSADQCIDDADCVSSDQGLGYCMYVPEVGHWACGYGQCVG